MASSGEYKLIVIVDDRQTDRRSDAYRHRLKQPPQLRGARGVGFIKLLLHEPTSMVASRENEGIDLTELGGHMSKCLKFCPGIEI